MKIKNDAGGNSVLRQFLTRFPEKENGRKMMRCLTLKILNSKHFDSDMIDKTEFARILKDRKMGLQLSGHSKTRMTSSKDQNGYISRKLTSRTFGSHKYSCKFFSHRTRLASRYLWPFTFYDYGRDDPDDRPFRYEFNYGRDFSLEENVELFSMDLERILLDNLGGGIQIRPTLCHSSWTFRSSGQSHGLVSPATRERQERLEVEDMDRECAQSTCAAKIYIESHTTISMNMVQEAVNEIQQHNNFKEVFDPESPDAKITQTNAHKFVVFLPISEGYAQRSSD